MGLEAAIAALQGPAKPPGLPSGVPPEDAQAYNYVASASRNGIPATTRPTAGGGFEVVTKGSSATTDGPLSAAISALQESTSQPTAESASAAPATKEPWWKTAFPTVALDTAASLGSAAVAYPAGAIAGILTTLDSGKFGTREGIKAGEARAKEVIDSLTYHPRTKAAQAIIGGLGTAAEAAKVPPIVPEMVPLSQIGRPKVAAPKPVTPAAKANPPGPQMASAGAAAVADPAYARAAVANATPETRAAVEDGIRRGMPMDRATLDRHAEAESLPVPVKLTQGQATQDVKLLSEEQNNRAKDRVYADRFNEQNKKLIENTDAIREAAAPDVYATTKPEHGELIIDAYKAKDAALNKDISAKYQALREANGGDFPLDAKRFADTADAALHKALLYDQVPSGLRATLDRLRDASTGVGGGMTFENFESLRTNLARIQRSQSADGNVKAAAGIIRDALEELPMPPGAEHLKPLADEARAAARARFALIEADPAYKAVTRGTASADKFIDKYVTAADLKNVQTMKENLTHDPAAQQAMAAGTINQLKQSAGIIDGQGNFSQAGYNKALEKVRPKLDVIFAPEHKRQLEALGNTARYTQAQPRGSFVNNSNTATTLIAEGAKNAAEGAANVAAKGIPVGTFVRKIATERAASKARKRSLEPGAGIFLRDVGKK